MWTEPLKASRIRGYMTCVGPTLGYATRCCLLSSCLVCVHGRPQDFFPGVDKLGGLETKAPPSGVQGWSPGEGLGAKPQKPTKKCQNNAYTVNKWSTERFTNVQNTLQHFQGEVPPWSCLVPAGAHISVMFVARAGLRYLEALG